MAEHYTVASRSFALMCCGECGIDFMMPSVFQKECQEKGKSRPWFCPHGHERIYRVGDAEELRQERDRLRQQLAQKDDEIKQARDEKTKVEKDLERTKKRISNGLCTCCNRSFANLARHMKTKHPEQAKLKVA